MALTLGDNFSYGGAKPLDARLKYSTTTEMKAVADATMYDGCLAYCTGTDKTYQWKSTNTVDETLGRWREFSSGGGSTGGGHTIEDSEGTDLTQRDTLQFGEGFLAEDDDTNEKTVISPDVMQSGDMSDVITPLPSVGNKMPVLFDESGAERVVGWYKYADGTKKPIYEKIIDCGTMPNNTNKSVAHGIANIDKITLIDGIYNSNSIFGRLPRVGYDNNQYFINIEVDLTNIIIATLTDQTSRTGYIKIQYTKTTDTAE